MKHIITIQIGGNLGIGTNFELKCLGAQIQQEVVAAGGTCLPIWDGRVLTIAIEGLPVAAVTALLDPYVESVRKRGGLLSVVQKDGVPSPVNGLPANYAGPGAIIRERMTRKLLFGLPEGAYVVSNLYPSGHSAFAERLGTASTRPDTWQRAAASGAAQRLCQVVWSPEEFEDAACGRLL